MTAENIAIATSKMTETAIVAFNNVFNFIQKTMNTSAFNHDENGELKYQSVPRLDDGDVVKFETANYSAIAFGTVEGNIIAIATQGNRKFGTFYIVSPTFGLATVIIPSGIIETKEAAEIFIGFIHRGEHVCSLAGKLKSLYFRAGKKAAK